MVKAHVNQGMYIILSCALRACGFRALLKKSLIVFSVFVMMSCPVMADTPAGYAEVDLKDFPAMEEGVMTAENYMQPMRIYKGAAIADKMLGITSGEIIAEPVYITVSCPANQYLSDSNECIDCPSSYPESNGESGGISKCYKTVVRGCTQNPCVCQEGSDCTCSECFCAGGVYIEYHDGTTSGTVANETCSQQVATATSRPGYFYNDGEFLACPKGTYKADSGNATSCTAADEGYYVDTTGATSQKQCPAGYSKSNNGRDDITDCYKTVTRGCTQNEGSVPDNCASVTAWNACTCSGETYNRHVASNGTSEGEVEGTSTNETCSKTPNTVTAKAGFYVNGTSCSTCPSGWSESVAGNTGGVTACYKTVTRGCTQNACVCPDNATCTCDGCACAGETYTQYVNAAGNGNGLTSGTTSNETCNQTVAGTTCGAGYYMNNGTCTACPKGTYKADSGNATSCTSASDGYYVSTTGATSQIQCPSGYRGGSDNDRDEVTDCYSNTRSRSWTGSQVNGTVPTGCSVTEWNSCSKSACEYVAYSNETGNGDGVLKSGCATNNESCTKTVKTVSANNNYYVEGTTCKACSSEYPNSEGGNIGATQCYYTCQSKTVQNASSVTPVYEKIYNNGGSAQACTYNVICNNGYTASGNGTANPSCDVTTITCPAGKYLPANGTACSVCPENNYCVGNTFDYPKAFAQGITECPAGLVSPQGTTSAGACGKMMYVDNTKLYLTKEKQTTPALAVKIDGVVYYAKTTPVSGGAKPMNSATTKSLRTKIDGIEYSIHDNTVQGE